MSGRVAIATVCISLMQANVLNIRLSEDTSVEGLQRKSEKKDTTINTYQE